VLLVLGGCGSPGHDDTEAGRCAESRWVQRPRSLAGRPELRAAAARRVEPWRRSRAMGALSPIWGWFRGAASALASACGRLGWVRDAVAPVRQPERAPRPPSGCTGTDNPAKQPVPAPVWRVLSAQDLQPATVRGGRPRASIFRLAIEVAFRQAKCQLGVGQSRNRVERAVERTVPRRSMDPRSERGGDAFVVLRRNPP
jgi:hypothetical protein